MKLETSNQAIEISGGTNTGSFSIAMNGKAFRVLSDTLYQNKIGSVVREISCNAYDSHVAAGKASEPFVIHLPDNFEPWFSVRDYGVGLTEEQIKTVFTVYFESTKDSSNDAIGAFGLGAKTPFSYTDQFTVTSIHNGVKSIYSAFIGPTGVPDMQLMHSSSTTEGNGVEIKMSVRAADFMPFYRETKEQLRFFKVKPVILNGPHFEFEGQITPIFEDENISVYNQHLRQAGDFGWIVQGVVGYKIDRSNLVTGVNSEAYAVIAPLMTRGYNFELKFNIGEIGVTASREGVEYNPTTLANIERKLLAVKESFKNYLSKKLDSEMSVWEKAIWLDENNPFTTAAAVSNMFPAGTAFDSQGFVSFNLTNFIHDNKLSVAYRTRNQNKLRHVRLNKVKPCKDFAILLKDKCTFFNMRINKFINSNNVFQVYVLDSDSKTVDASTKEKLVNLLGGCPNVHLLSDIQLDKVEREKLAVKRKSSVAEWYEISSLNQRNRQFSYVEDISSKKVYVYFSHGNYEYTKDIDLVSRYFMLKNFAKDIPPLIGVKISQKKEVEANKNLQSLEDYLGTIKSSDFDHLRVQWVREQDYAYVRKSLHQNYNFLFEFQKEISEVSKKFGKALSVYSKILLRAQKVSSHSETNSAQKYFGWVYTPSKMICLFIREQNNIFSNLPLLAIGLSNFGSLSKREDLIKYIKYVPH